MSENEETELETQDTSKTWNPPYITDDMEGEPYWRCHHGRAYGIRCSGCRREEEEENA